MFSDVLPGTYELSIVYTPRGKVTLGAADNIRRTLFDGLVRQVVVPESADTAAEPLELGVWEIELQPP